MSSCWCALPDIYYVKWIVRFSQYFLQLMRGTGMPGREGARLSAGCEGGPGLVGVDEAGAYAFTGTAESAATGAAASCQ
mgnify:CR=1 FL=1